MPYSIKQLIFLNFSVTCKTQKLRESRRLVGRVCFELVAGVSGNQHSGIRPITSTRSIITVSLK